MIAAPAPRRLLIGEEDGAVRSTIASRGNGVGVGGPGDAGKVQLSGERMPASSESRAAKSNIRFAAA